MSERLAEGVSLVVGVTGHRDLVLEEYGVIKERVRNFFLQLQQDYPRLPLLIMTPLAEGADRLAAEVAHELGIPTVVLLPMPRQIYQSDFQGDSLVEFHSLMEHSEVVELPLLVDANRDEVAQPGRARDMQYAQLGAYLAAHSHILLAIWDGKPSTAPGGTGHVIQFHQHDVIDLLAEGQHRSPFDFAEDESDLVFHVVCSRQEDGPPAAPLQPGETYWFTRDDANPRTQSMPERYQVVFERMGEFSADIAEPVSAEDVYGLMDEESMSAVSRGARQIAQLYEKVDYLARRYQRLTMLTLRGAFASMVVAGLCFIIYADMPEQELMIYPYLLFVAVVMGIFFVDRRRGWNRKHLDYRVLAEGLRVQFFWSVAGVQMENPSRFSHDSFLQRQDLELGWIRNIMRFAGRSADADAHDQTGNSVALVTEAWVRDQMDYYHRKTRESSIQHRRTSALGFAAYMLLLAVALVLAFFQWDIIAPWSNVLVALMGLLPLIATLRQNYAHRTAENENLLQFSYTHRVFANAMRLLEAAEDLTEKRDILRALGEAQLDENGQWLLRQRERPLPSGQLMH
jgi:hypothetical protein